MKTYICPHNNSLKLVYFNDIQDRPNLISYLAMKQDYSPDPAYLLYDKYVQLSEEELGERVLRLAVKHRHWGVLEHCGSLVFNVVGFPHDTSMQHRTHRVGTSFDVMSQRYTGKHFVDEYEKEGKFSDQFIHKYFYVETSDILGVNTIRSGLEVYVQKIIAGEKEEAARRLLPQGIRQHYVFSCNQRSLLHLLDVRLPANAQSEFRWLAELFVDFYKDYNPVLAEFYLTKRAGKNNLAP